MCLVFDHSGYKRNWHCHRSNFNRVTIEQEFGFDPDEVLIPINSSGIEGEWSGDSTTKPVDKEDPPFKNPPNPPDKINNSLETLPVAEPTPNSLDNSTPT